MKLWEYGYHADAEPGTPRGGEPGGGGPDYHQDRDDDKVCDKCGSKLVHMGSKSYCMKCQDVEEMISNVLGSGPQGRATADPAVPNTHIDDTYKDTTKQNKVLKGDRGIMGGEAETNEMVTSVGIGGGLPARMPTYGCPICKAQFPFTFMECPACHSRMKGESLEEAAEVSDKVKRMSGIGLPRMIRIRVLGNNRVKIVAPGINTVSEVYNLFSEPHIYLPRCPLSPFVMVTKLAEWYQQTRIGDLFTIDVNTGWTLLTNDKTGEAHTLGYAW